MTTTTLKKRINQAIQKIEDEVFLNAIYTIISSNGGLNEYKFTKDDIQILEERRKKYLSGNAKTFTAAEVRKKVMKNIQKK